MNIVQALHNRIAKITFKLSKYYHLQTRIASKGVCTGWCVIGGKCILRKGKLIAERVDVPDEQALKLIVRSWNELQNKYVIFQYFNGIRREK